MKRLFGTDGVRGVANLEPMTSETAMKLGRAATYLFKNETGPHRVVIGKDTRVSGYMLECGLTSGICSMGGDVLLVGPLPTPAVAFLTRSLRADAGIVISGSHNPFQDNGIKFFGRDGLKLPDALEKKMEELILSGEINHLRPTAAEIGKANRIDDAEGRYIEFVKNSLPKGMKFDGLKIVVDCANGAAYKVTPKVLRELGAKVIVLGNQPNGTNINDGCGCMHPALMQQTVRELGADLGIAHDGDADRVLFATSSGELLDGDHVMVMCSLELKRQNRLQGSTVVTTIMSNLGMERALNAEGIKMVRTAVGDRYVLERMMQDGYNFGGEQSGHIIFLDYNTTGDGLITALQVLALMIKTGRPLSELAACMEAVPQILINVQVKNRKEPSQVPALQREIERIEKKLNGSGRVLVRSSGTEPLVRVMIEGLRKDEIQELAEELAQLIQEQLG
jgi:phosphoglucosamine mutase